MGLIFEDKVDSWGSHIIAMFRYQILRWSAFVGLGCIAAAFGKSKYMNHIDIFPPPDLPRNALTVLLKKVFLADQVPNELIAIVDVLLLDELLTHRDKRLDAQRPLKNRS